MQSVLHGRTKCVKWCLENGADVTIGERDGYTPMHGAGFQGRADIAELLFKHGVGLRDVHEDGHEPASKYRKRLLLISIIFFVFMPGDITLSLFSPIMLGS